MATPSFHFQDTFPLGPDDTEYRLLSREGIGTATFEGREILKVAPEALAYLAQNAFHDCSFMLRTKHLEQVAAILDDPEASANDRYVALTLLKNAEIAAQGILPFCQDTGTAIIMGKKGQEVWTGANDAEWLSRGVYECYTKENLRYSQTAPLDMFKEVNRARNTNSSSSPKAAVRPTRPSCYKKPRLCSTPRAWKSS
jgi:fumarate hydratase class I